MSFWNDERDAAVKRMWSEDLTASQIAQRLGGTTRNAVIGRVRRLHLPYRNPHRVGIAPWRYGQDDRIAKARVVTNYAPKPKKKLPPVRGLLQSLPTEPLPPVDTMPAQVSFNDLESHHCRAIVAEHLPFDGDRKIYCGERKQPGKTYCACHVRRYQNTIPATAATRAVVQGVYRAPGKNFGVGHTARVNEFLTETT